MTSNQTTLASSSERVTAAAPTAWEPTRHFGLFGQIDPLPPFAGIEETYATVLSRLSRAPVVLILGLHRSATKILLHFYHANFGHSSKVLHAHGVSARFYRSLQHDGPAKLQSFNRTRKLVDLAEHAVVIVPLRAAHAKIPSFFLYLNRRRIGSHFDVDSGGFSHHDAIQADYNAFAQNEAEREAIWYREELLDAFGFDVLSVPAPTLDEPTIASVGGRTFILIRSETVGTVTNRAIGKVKGWSGTDMGQRNGMEQFGLLPR